ncbi:MAG: response regulator [Planctomycetota bacterium]
MTDHPISVYLADDHAMVREALAETLDRESGIEVVGQCGEGLAVLPEVRKHKPDVVVLDITLPGLNGLDICRDIVRRFKGVSVLMLTMHDNKEFVATGLKHGASGYLLKESAAEELVEAVRRVAMGELYLGPGIHGGAMQQGGDDRPDPYECLTTRERQVLQLVAEGRTNRQIAEQLGLAVKTVDTHRTRLMRKLDIHDQTSLVKYALRRGIVPLE